MFFNARKSFGKTISGYACIGECGMVLLPASLIKVWVSEAKNLGWYSSDPLKTRVLSLRDVKKHHTYVNSVIAPGSTIVPNKQVILLVADANYQQGVSFMSRIITTEPKVLVIDEAHLNRNAVFGIQSYCKWENGGKGVFDKQLLLSADVMRPRSCGVEQPYRMVTVKDLGDVPDIIWNVVQCWDSDKTWRTTLDEALGAYNKVVLVGIKDELDSIQFYDDNLQQRKELKKNPNMVVDPKRKRIKNKEYNDAKIFYQKKGIDTITKFNNYDGDCLLMINTAQDTGINVLADALVMSNAGSTNSTRITQSVGRVVRTTNDVDSVEIYLCAVSEQAYIRCHYARCYYNDNWKFKYDLLPTLPYLRKCVSILKMLGTSIVDVNSVDGCVIFADSSVIPDTTEILAWWKLHRTDDTVLTKDMVSDLMCM
jgi:hypothetical protein